MKKILPVLIVLLFLCGCGRNVKPDKKDSVLPSKGVSLSEAEVLPTVNENLFGDIGKTPKQIEKQYGKISETEWLDGAIYRFGECENWFLFSEYTIDGEEYIPKGKCTGIYTTFGELVNSPDGEYDIDVFKEAAGSEITMFYSEMDSVNVYEVQYGNYKFELSENYGGGVDEDSAVAVTKNN